MHNIIKGFFEKVCFFKKNVYLQKDSLMKQFKELKLGDKLGVINMKSVTICEYEVKDLALVNEDSVNIIYNFNGDNFTVYKHLPLTIYNNTMFFPLENYNEFICYAHHFFKEHTIIELKNNIKTLFRL